MYDQLLHSLYQTTYFARIICGEFTNWKLVGLKGLLPEEANQASNFEFFQKAAVKSRAARERWKRKRLRKKLQRL